MYTRLHDYLAKSFRPNPPDAKMYRKIPTRQPKQTDLLSDDETDRSPKFPRISRPVELLKNSYDCVVIGSGYGGSIAAARMARAGQSVCLLEKGKERWPGEYPTTARDALRHIHALGSSGLERAKKCKLGRSGPDGMYQFVLGEGVIAVAGSGKDAREAVLLNSASDRSIGLGGTSLINSNVFLEADARSLSAEVWPSEIRNNPECLKMCKSVINCFM